jgi:hypothetical protein
MGFRHRGWLRVGTAIAILGGLLWLVAEGDVGLPALLRSTAWGFVVWVGCGLIWIRLEHAQRYEDTREQWERITRVVRMSRYASLERRALREPTSPGEHRASR